MLAGELERDLFVMRRGVEAAALRPPAVVDGPAAENFRQLLESNVVTRVDKTVAQGRARDVTTIKRRDRQTVERIDNQLTQSLWANVLVQHPEEMADPGPAAVFEAFVGETGVDGLRELA